jgi:hypothetical protein
MLITNHLINLPKLFNLIELQNAQSKNYKNFDHFHNRKINTIFLPMYALINILTCYNTWLLSNIR